ncbi:hypothetical protein H9X90_05125 [Faecalicatena contorta]|uniref:hypothetical protein n=1 Tax=Faecalicatena contorta TaxID=39482 RepID=UPI0019608574|nr:hypothetical protein [Faecalicatena contorta]MBM6685392.1 hypothetical protein [Faecalicatena contorta]MBM6710133.1 hypothetical protein [Faecalicatena contorta]
MAKLDNTHQIIENIVGARLDKINDRLVLVNEEAFPEPIDVINMFNQYLGQVIDLKLGGATPISGSLFDNE